MAKNKSGGKKRVPARPHKRNDADVGRRVDPSKIPEPPNPEPRKQNK